MMYREYVVMRHLFPAMGLEIKKAWLPNLWLIYLPDMLSSLMWAPCTDADMGLKIK